MAIFLESLHYSLPLHHNFSKLPLFLVFQQLSLYFTLFWIVADRAVSARGSAGLQVVAVPALLFLVFQLSQK